MLGMADGFCRAAVGVQSEDNIRVVVGLNSCHVPSTARPVALRNARKKKTGHFGRDDRDFCWEARRRDRG
jgi:hypothetical protein